ncbi:MAG: hypothetical protein SGI74_11930 [Oligoflexia bacterium]|nr:hypothetical protein [Oligoflexia bacterium]
MNKKNTYSMLILALTLVGCGAKNYQSQVSNNSIPHYSVNEVQKDRTTIAGHLTKAKTHRIDNSKTDVEIVLDQKIPSSEQLSEIQIAINLIETFLIKYDRVYYINGQLVSPNSEEILNLRKILKKMKEIIPQLKAQSINDEKLSLITSRHLLSIMESTLKSRHLEFFISEGKIAWVYSKENHKNNADLCAQQILDLKAYVLAAQSHLTKYGEASEELSLKASDKFLKIKLQHAQDTLKHLEAGKGF